MAWLGDLLICLRFFSRLPVPETARERLLGPRGFAEAAAMAPLAGGIIGLVPAATLVMGSTLGLPPTLAATLAIAALVAVTGALHEDALADCADGFGGGRTRERKLDIMRDSRIGTFGACAIVLALMLRVSAIAAVAVRTPVAAAWVVIGAAVLSRAVCLLPLMLLRPARTDGVGASAGRLDAWTTGVAFALAAGAMVAIGVFTGHVGKAMAAIVAALAAALGFCALAERQIGGQTGDVAGGVQQAAEIVVLTIFSVSTAI